MVVVKINEAGLNIIKEFESLRLKAYRCPSGVLTIGYGRTGRVREDDEISETTAEQFLVEDVQDAEDAVEHLVKVPLTENQFSALVSFVFNVGAGAFERSTLLAVLNRKRYQDVPAHLLSWVYGRKNGVKVLLEGLKRRRQAEGDLFRS